MGSSPTPGIVSTPRHGVAFARAGIRGGVAKLLFIPFSVGGGLLAGVVAGKVFEQIWGVIDQEEPPQAEHRNISWGKLMAAAALQGAIFKMAREATDHGSRHGFAQLTGAWPGRRSPTPSRGAPACSRALSGATAP